MVRKRREERFSYPLRPGLASAGTRLPASDLGRGKPVKSATKRSKKRGLGPCPLVADGLQFHRAVRNRDPEGGADGAFDQVDIAAMGADQFGGDCQAKAAAARPAGGLE